MFPLSFSEYEEMKLFLGKTPDTNPQAELTNYILESGFPRTLYFDDPSDKRRYVQGVIKEIFEKDMNADHRVNYGPTLENILYLYACSQDCSVSVGRIGKLECDFIIRNRDLNYSYVQVAYTIALSKETEDREYRPLEKIHDNYPKYVMTTDYLLQKRNGILHVNLIDFMLEGKQF